MSFKSVLSFFTVIFTGFSFMNASTYQPEFSTAGFYQVDKNAREAISFNVGWRFFKGKVANAEKVEFDDKSWEVVNAPHGLELVPLEASGGVNYQGEAWYRKHFSVAKNLKGKKVFLHFEAIMGKSKVWINGKLLKEQFGGYLPLHIDVTDFLNYGGNNLVSVWADNRNDPIYPPGKPQETLDFCYFGGIYRDVWFITTNEVYVTNANGVDKIAGGGLFVHTKSIEKERAVLSVLVDLQNDSMVDEKVSVEFVLNDKDGKKVADSHSELMVLSRKSIKFSNELTVDSPHLWHVNDPYLHNLILTIKNRAGKVIDSFRIRVGIRTIEFRGKEGFFLNGEFFDDKLIGGNRHQDFAYIGNALPNNTHWRDAQKLRDASMRIIRCAHYPQDPAFMNACDELGLFVIVATPGWQFWNKEPIFEKRVVSDIRNMVRRDRNHPSVLIWEPILNETWYPDYFAKNVHDTVKQEYPFSGCYTACDAHARGQQHFDIIYSHPNSDEFFKKHYKDTKENRKKLARDYKNEDRPVFTREWGDCVDDWSSHNSPSRVAKGWGEQAQLIQAKHYANPDYVYSSWDALFRAPKQHFGGAIWHPFDHQRGYHPDPFWGGILDAFRRPKYSYFMFKSQMPTNLNIPNVDSKPFVYVAHEMTPFSSKDITVFSNCDKISLKLNGKLIGTKSTKTDGFGMPHKPVVFKDLYHFLDVKQMHRAGKAWDAKIEVEGYIDGKIVAKTEKSPSLRRNKIVLKADYCGVPLVADGSDIIPVVAFMTDGRGNVKRLSNEYIEFSVEGEGELIGDEKIQSNPQKLEWGEAVALIRASHIPGKIKIKARVHRKGTHMPHQAELTINSVQTDKKMLYKDIPSKSLSSVSNSAEVEKVEELKSKLNRLKKELNELKLKEVERQQEEFEGAKK